MPSNIEVKVRIADITPLRRLLVEFGARGPRRLDQADTYFAVACGRLKVRAERSGTVTRLELIGYSRRRAGIRTSRYQVVSVPPGERRALIAALSATLAVRAVVRKRRELWWVGADRVHLDRVERLGCFLEIEAPFGAAAQSMAATRRRTERLLARLGLAAAERIPGSYVDLLEAAGARPPRRLIRAASGEPRGRRSPGRGPGCGPER